MTDSLLKENLKWDLSLHIKSLPFICEINNSGTMLTEQIYSNQEGFLYGTVGCQSTEPGRRWPSVLEQRFSEDENVCRKELVLS